MDPAQKDDTTMTTTIYTETRFVIANAAGRPADDLGGSPIFASEAAAEEAVESLAASGFDMDDYSVRELTTDDLTGDERDAMLAAVRDEGEAAARQELAAWGDVPAATWAALDALLVERFGVVIARGRGGDDVCKAHRLAHKLRDPKFYTARTKRAVNSGGAL